jgi:hypothetical protein
MRTYILCLFHLPKSNDKFVGNQLSFLMQVYIYLLNIDE